MGLKLSSSKKKHKLYIYIYHRSSGIRQIINNLFYVAFSCQKPRSISPHSQNKHIARASTSESSMQLFHQAEVKFITSVTWHERKAESLHTHGPQTFPNRNSITNQISQAAAVPLHVRARNISQHSHRKHQAHQSAGAKGRKATIAQRDGMGG